MGDALERAFDVFWSHSGEQKTLVINLNKKLRERSQHLNNFLDKDYNSLMIGQPFAKKIFKAIGSCRVAVLFISKMFLESWWPMSELGELVELAACHNYKQLQIVPFFYGVNPSELRQGMEARAERWKGLNPERMNEEMIKKWKTGLYEVSKMKGIVIDSDVDDVHSTAFQRLLSDLRLLVATKVIEETNVNDEKLHLVCVDIDQELSEDNYTLDDIAQSVSILVEGDAISNLVRLLRFLNDKNRWVIVDVGWALDSILFRASNTEVKAKAVKAGAVEALVDTLIKSKYGKKPATFCLRSLLMCAEACERLIQQDKLHGGTLNKVVTELMMANKQEQDCVNACIDILQHLM